MKKILLYIIFLFALSSFTHAATILDSQGNMDTFTGGSNDDAYGARIQANVDTTGDIVFTMWTNAANPTRCFITETANTTILANSTYVGVNCTITGFNLTKGHTYDFYNDRNLAAWTPRYDNVGVNYPDAGTHVNFTHRVYIVWPAGIPANDVFSYASISNITTTEATASTDPPTFIFPTPTDGAHNNTNETINVSCGGNRIYLWFQNETAPKTLVIDNSTSGEWTTNVTIETTYYYRAQCWGAAGGFSTNGTIRTWVYDITNPIITVNPNNIFNSLNESTTSQYGNSIFLNMSFTDNIDLFAYSINFTKGGASFFDEINQTINETSFNYTKTVNTTAFTEGIYDIFIELSDSHTKKLIKDYEVEKSNKKLKFKTEHGNKITIESQDSAVTDAEKKIDRYTFSFNFTDGLTKNRTLYIKAQDNKVIYKADSPFKGHFIVRGNWIDFEGYGSPTVTFIDDKYYKLDFVNLPPNVNFNSIGGLNIINKTFQWYRGIAATTTPIATAAESTTLTLNLTFNSATQADINATLIYNGTAKTTSKVNAGGSIVYTSTFNAPDINGTIDFYWNITVFQNLGTNYTFNISGNQTILQYLIGVCDAISPFPILNMSYFDEINNSKINLTNGVNITFYTGASSFNVLTNFSGSTSDNICTAIDPAIQVVNLQYYGTVQLSKDEYVTRVTYLPQAKTFIASNDPIKIQKLFLIKIANSSTITYTWRTNEFQLIDGIMVINRCEDNGSKTFIHATRVSNGIAVANLQLFKTAYSYEIIIGNQTFSDPSYSSCRVESTTSISFDVASSTTNIKPTIGLFFIDCSLTNISSDTLLLQWDENTQDSGIIEGCIVGYQNTIGGKSEIFRSCLNASSGSFNAVVPNTENAFYQGELEQNGQIGVCQDTIIFHSRSVTSTTLGLNGLLAIVILIISLGLLFAGSGELQVLGGIIGVLISFFLGILSFPWEATVTIISFLVIIVIIGRYSKKRETE